MDIKLTDIIANIFIELDDNDLPMIIDLDQLYKIAKIIDKKEYCKVDLSGASLFELRFNSDKDFNYMNETKTIVPATTSNLEELKARFNSDVSAKLHEIYQNMEVKKVLGIDFISPKSLNKPGEKQKVIEKKMLNYFDIAK